VIAGRRNSAFYVCLIRPVRACPLRRLAKWGCAVLTIYNPWGCPGRLQRSGYIFGRSDWCYSTEDMQGCAFAGWAFFGVLPFLSYILTPKVHRSYRKISFWPLSEKISNFRYERIHSDTDSHIPAKFRGNRWSESDQTEAWYSLRKRFVLCPFLWGFWSDLAKHFTGSLFPRYPSLCQVLSKSVQFSTRYYIRNCSLDSLQRRREAAVPTKKTI